MLRAATLEKQPLPEAEPVGDLANMGRELASFWGIACGGTVGDGACDDEFLDYVHWQRGENRTLAAAIRDSAPGPDWLPCA